MEFVPGLDELRACGRMTWVDEERAWVARPDEIVDALSSQGFQEYKRESTKSRRDREPTGGVWQGLDSRTGAVASAIWVHRGDDALVFIDIDGDRVTGGEPSEPRRQEASNAPGK